MINGYIFAKEKNGAILSYRNKNSILSKITTVVFFVLTIALVLSSLSLVNYDTTHSKNTLLTIASAQEDNADSLGKSEDDMKKEIQDQANEYMKDIEEDSDDDTSAMDILGKLLEKAKNDKDPQGFGALVSRIFSAGYLNKTPNASNHNGGNGVNCNVFDPKAGTVLYHNCDVPNPMTQFMQTLASSFVQFGPIGAEKTSAALSNTAFGLPDNIPGEGAPILEEDRLNKYTALEIFGYNFRYTSYKGEWDEVKVQNSSRLMTGMGAFDKIRATFKAFATGLGHATEVAVDEFRRKISSGDIASAFGGLFTPKTELLFATINSLYDTADQNIFNNNAWYRTNFGSTMYGARELSSEEIAAEIQRLLVEYLTGVSVYDVEIPEDLKKIEPAPELPEEAISYCSVIPQEDPVTPAPGASQGECTAAWELLAASAMAAQLPPPPPMEWSIDGVRKQEPLEVYMTDYTQWRSDAWDDPNLENYHVVAKESYGIMCYPDGAIADWDTSIARRQEYGNQIRACWEEGWQKAVREKLELDQNASTGEQTDSAMNPEEFQKWVAQNPQERNYNAPWRRYVCLNMNGTDMRDAGFNYVYLYKMDGTRNSDCLETRNPIQNGLFGNGYDDSVNVPRDTRNTTEEKTIMNALIPVGDVFNGISNLGLSLSIYATRASNTIMNIAYGTTLDKLGIDVIVVKSIKELRDGAFLPLIVLVAALGAIVLFFRVMKSRKYREGFADMGLLAMTIIIGMVVLSKPQDIVDGVQEVPATVEKGILSAVFGSDGQEDDMLCTTSAKATSTEKNELGKESLSDDSVRRLLCENWRVGAYNVWSFGQFGVSPNKLNVKNMQNTNGEKVGNAQVHLGNGDYMNNWALYQLKTTTSGTASFADPSKNNGGISRDFYRIVDLQAGINNGAGTDDRYFAAWSGQNSSERLTASIFGAFSSIATAVTVIVYSIAKIQVSITLSLMLMVMPFMFLIGIHPTTGRNKMKNYFLTLLALMGQSVVLAALLAVMFKIMIGFGQASDNVSLATVSSGVVALVFFGMRKSVLGMVFDGVRKATGQAPMFNADKQTDGTVPGYLANKLQRAGRAVNSTTGGMIGGFAAGGLSGAEPSMKRAFNSQMAYVRRMQRYKGKGAVQTFTEGFSNASKEAKNDMNQDMFIQDMREDALKETREYKEFARKQQEYEDFNGEEKQTFGGLGKMAPDGTFLVKPKEPKVLDSKQLSRRQARKVSKKASKVKTNIKNTEKDFKKQGINVSQYGNVTKDIKDASFGDGVERKFRGRSEVEFEDKKNRPLTQEEMIQFNEKVDDSKQKQDKLKEQGQDVYRRDQNVEYTKQEMKDSLREVREKLGEQNAKRRFF